MIAVIPVSLFNKCCNQYRPWINILFGNLKEGSPLEISHNDDRIKMLGVWYLILTDLMMGQVIIDGDQNAKVVVGLNFKPYHNDPYLLKWRSADNSKFSVYDKFTYIIKDHRMTPIRAFKKEEVIRLLDSETLTIPKQ